MTSESYNQALDNAAALWGIDPEYWDIWGQLHVTSAETKKAVLQGLGVPAETQEQLDRAIEERRLRALSRLVPRCLVLSESHSPREFLVHLPEGEDTNSVHVTVRREDGPVESYEVHGHGKFPVPLPRDLPPGYHDVEVSLSGGARESMRLIIAPDRAYCPPELAGNRRLAGVAVALYGLRSGRNWGCGDFRDLHGLIDWVADEVKASFIALNPLHAIHNRRPYNTSPYLPNSVFYQNFIYLDVEAIEDFQKSKRALRHWSRPDVQKEVEALRGTEHVEYERVHAFKLRFLKLLFVTFLREFRVGSARAAGFRDFIAKEGELLDRFATYCAIDEYMHRGNPDLWLWTDWPEAFRDPGTPEVQSFQKKHWRSILFYKYMQWQIDLQLAAAQEYARKKGLAIGLYHDLALATDRFGSDLWAHRPFYVAGCRVGSPPDDFSPKGQDWAFPPPNSEHHRETGYRLFTESIRKNCRHGGALRIDHVMRFFRLYWIPDGADATRGAYVRDRHEDLIRILALESVRHQVVVIGEDLGTVEPSVRETLARFGILSYRLFYFEKADHGEFTPAHEYPEQALVSSTTHDLPTLAGFWVSEDIKARRRAGTIPDEQNYRAQLADRAREKQKMLDVLFRSGLLPESVPRSASDIPELTGELHNAVIGFLASTPSKLMVVNQEDLTKELAQQNLPGTTWQYPNWCRKMKFTLEELQSSEVAHDFTAMFRHWLERTGRKNPVVSSDKHPQVQGRQQMNAAS